MAKRYECTLSSDVMKKAAQELNEPEDNSVRLASIDRLKKRFQEECKDLELIRSDDAFLLRFLRVRKYDEDRAFATLKNYHERRKESREIFDLVDNPKSLEEFISSGALVPLREGRARDGTFVLCARLGHGFKENGDIVKFMATAILTMEKLLENEEFQVYGATLINDMSEMRVSYVPYVALYSKTMSHIMQEAMPIRIKSMNMINESAIVDVIYSIITKFMKEKLKNRLQLHGTNVQGLHAKIDPKYLPFALGGTGPDLNETWWTQQVVSHIGAGEDTAL